jgi:hypothetical protein
VIPEALRENTIMGDDQDIDQVSREIVVTLRSHESIKRKQNMG